MSSTNSSYEYLKRFAESLPSLISLIVILCSVLLAIFCYVLMPDSSPNANTMNLSLSLQKPGFKVEVIKMPQQNNVDQNSWIEMLFTGRERAYKEIAVSKWEIKNDSLIYFLYTGIDGELGMENRIPLSELHDGRGGEVEDLDKYIETKTYWLGTDRYGRDMLSRMLAGTRVSLSVGFISVLISLLLGITLGALAGYFKGWVDDLIMFLINIIWSIPTLLLVVAITFALGKGFVQVFIAVGLTMWVDAARIVRGQVLSAREYDYVEAGRALGFSHSRIIFKHILPNIMGPVAVVAASNFASAILLEAGLSFLGLGAQPPTPSWGMMVKDHYGYLVLDAAYLALLPGFAIFIMVLCFTLVGNGIRDTLDTKESYL